jgi:hypothetical protein
MTLRDAMKRIAKSAPASSSCCVITPRRAKADAVSALGQRVEHAASAPVAPQVLRTYGIGAADLKDSA